MNKIILNKHINKSPFLKVWAVVMAYIFLFTQVLFAHSKAKPEYHTKAAFLLNFTRVIDWPSTAFSTVNAPFVIGVLGNNPFGAYIEELLKDEKAGKHPIIVRRYKSVQKIGNCHILFINPNNSVGIQEI